MTEPVGLVLGVSILLQLVAALLALRLVKVTGWHVAWVAVSAGLLVMALRRLITFARLIYADPSVAPDMSAELVALTISVLMVAGIAGIAPLFVFIRRNAEALRRSETSFANAQRIASLGNWDWDIVNNELYWSDEIYRIFGLRPREFSATYEAFLERVHPDDREAVDEAVRKALEKGTRYSIHHRIVRPDGGERIIHEQAEVTFGENGRPVRMSGTVHDVSERRKAEEALRTSQQMLQTILDSIPARVFWKDRNSTLLGCNRRFCEDAGLASPDEVVGKTDFDLPWAENAELYRADDRRVMDSGVPKLNYEEPKRWPDGTRHWVRINKIPLRNEDGEVASILGCYEDITERKCAEQARKESEARLRAIASALPDLVFLVDRDGRFLEVLTAQQSYQYVRPEVVEGKPVRDVLPEDVAERFLAAERRTLATGQPQTLEYALVIEGERRWFEARTAPVDLPSSQNRVVAVVSRDVTDRKLAEASKRESVRMLSTLIGNLPGMVYRCRNDRDWTIQFVSQGCRELTGYDPGDLIDNRRVSYNDLIHPDDRQSVWDEVQEAIREARPFPLVYRIRTAVGKERWVWEQGTGVFSDDGDLVALEGFVTDITDRKAVEDQLRQAQKMEAVGQLTGGVAHDFNNLLTVILGNLDLLDERLERLGVDANLRRSVALATEAADRASVLTQRLLAFSRKQVLEPRVVDVNALLAGMLDLLGRSLGKTVEIKFAGADGLWPCKADPGQLENSLLNLVLNARDATPEGGTITIETANADVDETFPSSHGDAAPGQYVMLAVADTGTGISPEALERVFEPFFTTKAVGEGSGLGLSMVYGFVKQSGGFVSVSSTEGEGTTVRIFLPRTRAGAEDEPAADAEGPPEDRPVPVAGDDSAA